MMATGNYDCTCGTNCPRCGYTFTINVTTGIATSRYSLLNDPFTHFTNTFRELKEALTRAQLAQRAAEKRAALFKPPMPPRVAPVVALNAGMHLRRMRACTGLARGRA